VSNAFRLDPRLQADSLEIGRTGLSSVRLMDDARWPWILLVPERPDIREWFDLTEADARRLLEESRALGRVMLAEVPGARLNVANLGNIVAQFHLHHVVRTPGDPAWPGPVWGFGERQPHEPDQAAALRAEWAQRLADLLLD
jgi:diadenosine tetraphosphate (Ap4A) HIT family hydrolase